MAGFRRSNLQKRQAATRNRLPASGLAKSFSPAEYSPQLWLDADDARTLAFNGSAVSAWANKGTLGGSCSQGTPANQPSYSVDGLAGRGVLTFDGTNDNLATSSGQLSLITRSVFVIFGESSSVANAGVYVARPATGNDYERGDALVLGPGSKTTNSNTTNLVGAPTTSYTLIHALGNVASPFAIYGEIKSAGSGTLYVNGTSAAVDSSFTEFSSLSGGGWLIGARISSGAIAAPYFSGRICEVLHFGSTLTTGERQKVEGYLAWKWGIQGLLPSGHPHLSAPP
jgi:hypothetical protein